MELLSYELTTRIAQRQPSRILAPIGGPRSFPGFFVASAFRLFAACARGGVAVLHLGDPVLAPLAVIARAFGVPVVVTIHGLDVTYDRPLYRWWLRAFLRRMNAYVCISAAARATAIERGVPAERAQVIGIGIDVSSIPIVSTAREDDLLLFVGRLVRRKGLAWFVRDVLPELATTYPRLRLAVLGDGPERKRVAEAATEARVLDRLIWLGPLTDAQKWQWYARASLCIMPNIHVDGDMEGFGIVALEAMAAGCPLVAADLEGLRDAVEDRKGCRLLRSADAPAWRETLRHLLDHRDTRDHLGADARRWVRATRQWNSVIDRYEAVFVALVAEHQRR
jgi:phosphatidylinositol alpha-1,6-mannosyltransferase